MKETGYQKAILYLLGQDMGLMVSRDMPMCGSGGGASCIRPSVPTDCSAWRPCPVAILLTLCVFFSPQNVQKRG